MIVSFTGHRSDKIGGWNLPNPTYISICRQIEKILRDLKPSECISGMALGFDSYAANVCINIGIPFIAAIPFIGQEKAWPEKSQKTYNKLLSKAKEIVIVSDGGYSAAKMQIRNEYLVNNCNILVSCFRLGETSGGTFNCIQYAKKVNKQIIAVDPDMFYDDVK